MLYFSEIKGKKVFTEDKVYTGRAKDLIFLATQSPDITKIVVQDPLKQTIYIPISYVARINSFITIHKNYEAVQLDENELYLDKNIIDQQIIDIKGNKIVRVNDVAIQDKDLPKFYVAGVDIGILGILRWLRVENFFLRLMNFFGVKMSSNFLSWANIQPLELTRGKVRLKEEEQKLKKISPADLADHLEKTNVLNVKKILGVLDEKFAAEVISDLNINYQSAVFRDFSPDKAVKVIELIDPDEAVDILLTLPLKRRDQIVTLLPPKKSKELSYLLGLPRTTIGELVTSEYFTVYPNDTAREVINKIKKESSDFSFLPYIYVINDQNQLTGVFNLHELLLQDENAPVYKFMYQNLTVIHLTTPGEIAVRKLFKYKLSALPVIDKDKKIIGIVTIDDLAEIILSKV